MATKLFFRATNLNVQITGAPYSYGTGRNDDTRLPGGTGHFRHLTLSTDQGASAVSIGTNTQAGPISPTELSTNLEWISAPLADDVTISGAISFNVWSFENNMSANATIGAVVDRVTNLGTVASEVGRVTLGTEVDSRAYTAYSFSIDSPTSTAFNKGDRIRIRLFMDDADGLTMSSGYFVSISHSGGAGVQGDSYVTFTETFSVIETDPTTTTIYLTDAASDVSTAAVDREAWTSRGAGVQTDVTNTVTGWTDGVQLTDTAGGTVVDWWTPPLEAFTLGGAVLVNARQLESGTPAQTAIRCEIAVTAGDGSSPVVWGSAQAGTEIGTTESARQFYVSGDDYSVSDGQRLRIRFLLDDFDHDGGSMASGYTVTSYYAGTSGGASGDTYLVFPQTLSVHAIVTDTYALDAILAADWGWVTPPADAATMGQTPTLTFQSPDPGAYPGFFEIQLDTASTFNTANLRRYTSVDGTWEYYNGSSWVAMPSTGMPEAAAGNEARFTVPASLTVTTWYRRIRYRVG